MKNSIAITLIVVIGVFGFTSGYSIGLKNGSHKVANLVAAAPSAGATQSTAVSGGYGAPAAAEQAAPAPTGGYGASSGGYGAPASQAGGSTGAVAPGYGN